MKVKIGNYASYIEVKERKRKKISVAKTVEIGDHVYVDYDSKGKLIGIEILAELEPEYYSDYKKKEQ